ncbi:MAG: hypothetical protein ABIU84_13065, partial [Thermoanaerobaculia bacterium]
MAKSAKTTEPGVLDELNRLGAERGPIAGWLEGLEAGRDGVSEAVYRRVREDYSKRIAELDRLARPLRIEATRTVALLDEQLAQLATGKLEVEFDLQEIELRYRLEEYSEAEFESRAKVPRERIEELDRELEKVRANRELWLAARGEEVADSEAQEVPDPPRTPRHVGASTAAVSLAPAPPEAAAPLPPPAPSAPMAPMFTLPAMPASPPAAQAPPVPATPGLSPASITMPRPIPGPQPSSPAIPAPHIADAAARTV